MGREEEKRVGYRVGLIQWNTEKASRREGGKQEGERVRERGFSLRYVVYHAEGCRCPLPVRSSSQNPE